MGDLGVPELLIILAIAVAIFGTSKLAGVGKALGTSIRDFRRSVRDDEPEDGSAHAVGARNELHNDPR